MRGLGVALAAVLLLQSQHAVADTCRVGGHMLLEERFNDVQLGPMVSQSLPTGNVWSSSLPSGWEVTLTSTMKTGAPEFQGWTVWDTNAWVDTYGRGSFTGSRRGILVADISKWKEVAGTLASQADFFNSVLQSPVVNIPNDCTEALTISYQHKYQLYSSAEGTRLFADWYADDTLLTAQQLEQFTSTQTTTKTYTVTPPDGATRLRLRWTYNMGSSSLNGLWFAIDNVLVRYSVPETPCTNPGVATWVGGDGDWTNPNNWCDGRVPDITDDVLLDCAHHVECDITINGATDVNSIRVSTAANAARVHLRVVARTFIQSTSVVDDLEINVAGDFVAPDELLVLGDLTYVRADLYGIIRARGDVIFRYFGSWSWSSMREGFQLLLDPVAPRAYTFRFDQYYMPVNRYQTAMISVGRLADLTITSTSLQYAGAAFEISGTVRLANGFYFDGGVFVNDGAHLIMAPTDSVSTYVSRFFICRDGATITAPPPTRVGWLSPELYISGETHFEPGCDLVGSPRLLFAGGAGLLSSKNNTVSNITMAGGEFSVTAGSDVSSMRHVRVTGGSLHFADTAPHNPLYLTALQVTGTSYVHLHGNVFVSNASLAGTSSRLVVYDAVEITHTFTWSAGYVIGATGKLARVAVGRNVAMQTTSTKYLYSATLVLPEGHTSEYSAGDLYIYYGGQIVIPPTARWRIVMSDQIVYQNGNDGSSSSGSIENRGTIEVVHRYALSLFTLRAAFDNLGMMILTGGTMRMVGPLTHAGTLRVHGGAFFVLQSGSTRSCRSTCEGWKVLAAGSTLEGNGVIEVDDNLPLSVASSSVSPDLTWLVTRGGLDFNVAVPLRFGTVTFTSGTLRAVRESTLHFRVLRLRGGTFDVESAVWSVDVLAQTAGTLMVRGALTVAELEWLGGSWQGAGEASITVSRGVICGTSQHDIQALRVDLLGPVTWQDEGGIVTSRGAQVIVAASGSLTVVRPTLQWSASAEAHEFSLINLGTLRFSPAQTLQSAAQAAASAITFGVGIHNEGQMVIDSGMVACSGSLVSSGGLYLSSSAILRLSGARGKVLAPGSIVGGVSGAGLGTIEIQSPLQIHATRVDLKALRLMSSSSYETVISSSVQRCSLDQFEASSGTLIVNARSGAMNVRTVIVTGATIRLNTYLNVESLDMRSGTLNVGVLLRVVGDIRWQGGVLSGTGQSDVDGSLFLLGTSTKTIERLYLRLGGGLQATSTGTLSYSVGARIDLLASSASFLGGTGFSMSGTGRLVNMGNITINLVQGPTSAAPVLTIGIDLDNRKRVAIENGQLDVTQSFATSGDIIMAAACTLRLTSQCTFAPGSRLLGSGTLITASSTTLIISADRFEAAQLRLVGGRTTVDPSVNLEGLVLLELLSSASLEMTRDELKVSNLTVVGSTCQINTRNLQLDDLLLVSGTLTLYGSGTVSRSFTWLGGTLGGGLGPLLVTADVTALTSTTTKTLNRDLHMAKEVRVSGSGTLSVPAEAQFRILPTGRLELGGADQISITGQGAVQIDGTLAVNLEDCPPLMRLNTVRVGANGRVVLACGILELTRLTSVPGAAFTLAADTELTIAESTTLHASIAGAGTLAAKGGRVVLPRTAAHDLRALRVENNGRLIVQEARVFSQLDRVTVIDGDVYLYGELGENSQRLALGAVEIATGGVYISLDVDIESVLMQTSTSLLQIGRHATVNDLQFRMGRIASPQAGTLVLRGSSRLTTTSTKVFEGVNVVNDGKFVVQDPAGGDSTTTVSFADGASLLNENELRLASRTVLSNSGDGTFGTNAFQNRGRFICRRVGVRTSIIGCFVRMALVVEAGGEVLVNNGLLELSASVSLRGHGNVPGTGGRMVIGADSELRLQSDVDIAPEASIQAGRVTFQNSVAVPVGILSGAWDVDVLEVALNTGRVTARLDRPDVRIGQIVMSAGELRIDADAGGTIPPVLMRPGATATKTLRILESGVVSGLSLANTNDQVVVYGPVEIVGQFTWRAGWLYGFGAGEYVFAGDVEVVSSSAHRVSGDFPTLTVRGDVKIRRDATLSLQTPAPLVVTGQMDLEAAARITTTSRSTVVNQGVVRLAGGARASVDVDMYQQGTLHVPGGELVLTRSAILSAPINITNDGILVLQTQALRFDDDVDFSHSAIDIAVTQSHTFSASPNAPRIRNILSGDVRLSARPGVSQPTCVRNVQLTGSSALRIDTVPVVASSLSLSGGQVELTVPLTVAGTLNLVALRPTANTGPGNIIVHGDIISEGKLELPSGTNLLINGDFSVAVGGEWVRVGAWSRSTSYSIYGFGLYASSPPTGSGNLVASQTYSFSEALASPQQYRLSAFMQGGSASQYRGLEVVSLNDAGETLFVSFNSSFPYVSSAWDRFDADVTLPAGTKQARIGLRSNAGVSFDNIFFGLLADATPQFDVATGYTRRRFPAEGRDAFYEIFSLAGNPCNAHSTCSACSSAAGCGWSVEAARCLPGTAAGPNVGSSCTWVSEAGQCPVECMTLANEDACEAATNAHCVWCPSGTCRPRQASACANDADLIWSGAARNQLFEDPANWLPMRAPGATDAVLIPATAYFEIFTASVSTELSIRSLHVTGHGGLVTFRLRRPLTVLAACKLSEHLSLEFANSNAAFTNQQDVVFEGRVSGTSSNTITLRGPGKITVQGEFDSIGRPVNVDTKQLVLQGLGRWSSYSHQLSNGATLLIDTTSEQIISGSTTFSTGSVTNRGRIRVLSSALTFSGTGGTFVNEGTILLEESTMSVTCHSIHTGHVVLDALSTLSFGGSSRTHSVQALASFTGQGRFYFSGSSSTVTVADTARMALDQVECNNGAMTLPASALDGRANNIYLSGTSATLTLAGPTPVVIGSLTLYRGTMNINTDVTVTEVLALTGGTLAGTGHVTVTAISPTFVSSGYLTGAQGRVITFTADTEVYMSSTVYMEFARVEFQGRTLVSATTNYVSRNAQFVNNGYMTFFGTGQTFQCTGSCGGQFINTGNVEVTLGSVTDRLTMSLALLNSGTINIHTGEFFANSGGDLSGLVSVNASSTFRLDAGTFALGASSSVRGEGELIVRGDVTLDGALAIAHLRVIPAGKLRLLAAAMVAPFKSITMGQSSSAAELRLDTYITTEVLTLVSGTTFLNAHRLDVTGSFTHGQYATFRTEMANAQLVVKDWRWVGGTFTMASTAASLRLTCSGICAVQPTSTLIVEGGAMQVAAAVTVTRPMDMTIRTNGHLHLVDGTSWTCRQRCSFATGLITIDDGATMLIRDEPDVTSLITSGMTIRGTMALESGNVDLAGALAVFGTLRVDDACQLRLTGQGLVEFDADSIVTMATLVIRTTGSPQPVRIASRALELEEMSCESTSGKRTIEFVTGVRLAGLRAIVDPNGRCDVALPVGDLTLDHVVVGDTLRLASADSTLRATSLVLRGQIRGPGRVEAETVAWFSGGFTDAEALLGPTAIFATSILVEAGADVTLTKDSTLRTSATTLTLDMRTGATLRVAAGAQLRAEAPVTVTGGASETLENRGTFVLAQAESSNIVRCRFRNSGIFSIPRAAEVELQQLEVEAGGQVLLTTATSKIRITSRISSVDALGRIEGGIVEVTSSSTLSVPADRLHAESVTVTASATLEMLPGETSGVTFTKSLIITNSGIFRLGASVILPAVSMSDTSSQIVVLPSGFLSVALLFGWQGGWLYGEPGQVAIKVDGALLLSTSTTKQMRGLILQVQGTVTWTQGTVSHGTGSQLHILRGGTFALMTTQTMSGAGSVQVDGTMEVTVCGSQASLSVPLNVTGTVNVRGALQLNSGGTLSTTSQLNLASDGARVLIAGSGQFIVEALDVIVGELGELQVSSGHLVARGGSLPVPLTLSGGQLEAGSTATLARGIYWTSGTVRASTGVVRVTGDSEWTGGTMAGSLVWDGLIVVSSTSSKSVTGAMSIGSGGTMRHVQGTISVSGNGNFVIQHGGLLVGEPQGATTLSAPTERLINLGTISVVSVAEAYQMNGLANHGRLIALRGVATLQGQAVFGPTSEVKGTGNVTVASSLVLGGRIALNEPGMLVCAGCTLLVRDPTWVGGRVHAQNMNMYRDYRYCPEATSFTSSNLLAPACPKLVLTFEGTVTMQCASQCNWLDYIEVVNRGYFSVTDGTLYMTKDFVNHGVAVFEKGVVARYIWLSGVVATVVNQAGGVLILRAPERNTDVETLAMQLPIINQGGIVRAEGERRASAMCLESQGGHLIVDLPEGLRVTGSGDCGTIRVTNGGLLTGSGKLLQPLTCNVCTVRPGPGILTVAALARLTDATLIATVRGAEEGDQLVVTAALELVRTALEIEIVPAYVATGVTNTRVTPTAYTAVTGTFNAIRGVPQGMTANVAASATEHVLTLTV